MSLSHREGSRGGAGKIILKVSAWGGWGSCGESGRGRVQICHKGVPRRDRPRRKARNINDSSRALRLDPGLCGRFGQSAGADRPGRASAGRTAGPAPERTIPPDPSTSPGPRERRPGQDPGTRTGPRGSRPSRVPPGRSDPSRTRRFPVERAPPVCAFDWKPARSRKNGSRKSDGPGPANRPQNTPSPPTQGVDHLRLEARGAVHDSPPSAASPNDSSRHMASSRGFVRGDLPMGVFAG